MLEQKWPASLTALRHAQSAYNRLRYEKAKDPLYQEFLGSFEADPISESTLKLAHLVLAEWALQVGDHDTPLAPGAERDAQSTGEALKIHRGRVPDIIYVSPYIRTNGTLQALTQGWPELADVPTVEEVRIREQEHGLAGLYSDWRLFFVFHPEQRLLQQMQNIYWYRYPQGENIPDVQLRLQDFLGTLIREHAGQDVMLVTHHLTILALRMLLERFDWKEFLRIDEHEKPINCGVTTYTSTPGAGRGGQGKLVLQSYNEKLY